MAWGMAALLAVTAVSCGGDSTTTDGAGDAAAADSTTTSGADDAAGADSTTTSGADSAVLHPDVTGARATLESDGSWTFSVTISSPYDTAVRYADAWRVTGPDGEVYGVRELTHDHQAEQPFTRSQSGIEIPDEVDVVTVEGRDQISGWGGAVLQVELDRGS